jgi:hypothetical protein
LGDHVRRDVGVGRQRLDLLDDGLRADQVADADARADGLRERRRVDDPAGLVLREHRRQRLALEADPDVRIVLEEREVVGLGEPQQARALLGAQRVARGVLEVGDDVGELRVKRAALQQRLDGVDVDPVGLELDHPHVGLALAKVQQRAVVGRRLDDHRVARLDQQCEQERVGLHRAVGDQHLLDLDAVLLGDPLAQRDVAHRRAVGERARRIVLERALRGLAQALGVDDVERRGAPGEGDGGGHGPQDGTGPQSSRWRSRHSPTAARTSAITIARSSALTSTSVPESKRIRTRAHPCGARVRYLSGTTRCPVGLGKTLG